jgi:Ice-binding-like/Putative Ig domain
MLGGTIPLGAQSILKSAGNYSVLASQGITVAGTGFSIVNGNVGLFPAATTNITGFPPGTVSGTTLAGTAAAIISTGGATQQAEADLQVAATGLAAMAPNANYSNVDMANLGALPPGVYKWNAAATLTGALILDAQGKNNVSWVFQIGTSLTTALNSSVTVINPGSNGGGDDGIFWNAATGAIVIGDNNTILGNYIAYTSISFTGSTLLLGNAGTRFLALNAAVTFAGPGSVNALGGAHGSDWTGGLTLNGATIVATTTGSPGTGNPGSGTPGSGTPGTGTPGTATPGTASPGAPVITSPSVASGTAGAAFPAITISATGTPATYSVSGLPAGLSFNTQTGQITGTATVWGTFVVTITATNSGGTSTSTVTITINSSHIVNFSARAMSGPGADTLIVGFVIAGNGKNLLLRADGPALAAFGITNFMPDPILTLDDSNGSMIASNDNWQTTSGGVNDGALIAATAASVGAFALPSSSQDSALLVTLNNGAHTTGLVTANSASGVGLVEIYDTGGNPSASLINVSARMNVTTGDGLLIAGFSIAGNAPKTVLVRGVGPTLTQFGVPGVLADPQITVFSGSTQIATNANWATGPSSAAQVSSISAQVGAFPLASGNKDAALILTLQPGAYTVQVSSVSGATGVALVEVYDASP